MGITDLIIDYMDAFNYDINRIDESGNTRLFYFQHTFPASIFIGRGADVNVKNCIGDTPLHYTASNIGSLSLTKLLTRNNASINAKNNNGKTPLDRAEDAEHSEIIRYLKSKGAINGEDEGCGIEWCDGNKLLIKISPAIPANDGFYISNNLTHRRLTTSQCKNMGDVLNAITNAGMYSIKRSNYAKDNGIKFELPIPNGTYPIKDSAIISIEKDEDGKSILQIIKVW